MNDPDGYGSAVEAFQSYVAVCTDLAEDVKPTDSTFRVFVQPTLLPQMLAEAAENTQEFASLAHTMSVVAPPALTDASRRAFGGLLQASFRGGSFAVSGLHELHHLAVDMTSKRLHEVDFGAEPKLDTPERVIYEALREQARLDLKNYLRRTGFYHELLGGQRPDFAVLMQRFGEVPIHAATSWIAIEGIQLKGGDVRINEATRLRTLDREAVQEFFELPVTLAFVAEFRTPSLEGRSVLELHHKTESEEMSFFDFPRRGGYEEPCLTFINLFSECTAHIGERFFKYNSMRRFPHLGGPERFARSDDLDARFPIKKVYDAETLQAFIAELEQGRQAASADGRPLDIALRVFARACRDFYDDDLPPHLALLELDMDESARTIIDYWTVMEIVFEREDEAGERFPGIERAVALLALDNDKERPLRNELHRVRKIRNGIIHGRSIPDPDLIFAERKLRIWTAKALTAFLRMRGDQRRIIDGVGNPELKVTNRTLVPTYDSD